MTDGRITQAEKENVVIKAGACSVTLLPHIGGKISSIRINNQELLQTPLAALKPRTRTMPFNASDASGWNECLPSVSACTVKTAAGPADVPDHGDLWRVAWESISPNNGNFASLRSKCFSLPLTLERGLSLTEMTKGWQIRLDYRLTNTGGHATPWSWAAHPLFAVDPG